MELTDHESIELAPGCQVCVVRGLRRQMFDTREEQVALPGFRGPVITAEAADRTGSMFTESASAVPTSSSRHMPGNNRSCRHEVAPYFRKTQ